MKKVLVENEHGHGAKLNFKWRHKLIRNLRPMAGDFSFSYDWSTPWKVDYDCPILNQYQAGSCGGHMMAYAIQVIRTLKFGKTFEKLSPLSFYSQGYASGGGMTIDSVKKVAGFMGITTFDKVPTPENCTEEQARSLEWATPENLKDALYRNGLQMVSVPIDIDSMAKAVKKYGGIGIIVLGKNNGTWTTTTPKPPTDKHEWAHYMWSTPSIDAIPTGTKYLKFYQSWGEKIGDKGKQNITEDYVKSGFIYDCFSFKKFTFENDLSVGSTGEDVKYLQARLGMPTNTYGFGIFGPKTKQAVISYQKANGLPQTGYVGKMTRKVLNS